MRNLVRLFAVSLVGIITFGSLASAAKAPLVTPQPLSVALRAYERVYEPTRRIPKTAKCPQHWNTARAAGWAEEDLMTLDFIMNRESRCQPKAHNTTLNRNKSQDYGLTQINDRSWCLPSRYHKAGYLQGLGIIEYCKDLLKPLVNLTAAKALYDYSKKTGSGFRPWGL
jgi:hypothetical protein